ncbi:MAG TPA: methyltransferase domain-containing protein [Dehalococcoidia bacterium]
MTKGRARQELAEWLDRPENDPAALAANLRDLRRLNRLLGWTAGVVDELERLTRAAGLRRVTVLDVATGSADVPLAMARWAARQGVEARVLASDVSGQVLAEARALTAGEPAIDLLRHEGTRIPLAAGAVDVATCCLALHHFGPEAAVALLRELGRVARRGVIVCDLERSAAAYWAAVAAGLLASSPLTRHDGPVSVRRAYTRQEAEALARAAGLDGLRARQRFPFRWVLSGLREGDGRWR